MPIEVPAKSGMNQTLIKIGPSSTGAGSRLETQQFLPYPRDRVFEFFSDASQLEALTPPWLHFAILTASPIRIEAGTHVDYRLKLHGIPIRWRSCISVWEPPHRFVDEQVRGPYRLWHHEHVFEEVDGGTLCTDIVNYRVPGGRLIDALAVRPDLRGIFAYRRLKLDEFFPNPDLAS